MAQRQSSREFFRAAPTNVRQAILMLLFGYPTHSWEGASVVLGYVWGMPLLLPPYEQFVNWPHYRFLAEVAPEWTWGAVAVVLSTIVCISALFIHESDYFRIGANAVLGALWATVGWALFQFAHPPASSGFFFVFMAFCWLTAARQYLMRRGFGEPFEGQT